MDLGRIEESFLCQTFYDINPLFHILSRKTVGDTAELYLPSLQYGGAGQENVFKVLIYVDFIIIFSHWQKNYCFFL